MAMQEKTTSPLKKALRGIGIVVLAALMMAVFYLAVVMGQPQPAEDAENTTAIHQPLLPNMPSPILILKEEDMHYLAESFPVPLMYPLYGTSLTFEKGVLEDYPFEDGRARIVTLTYHIAGGSEMTVTSIYPARAISLVPRGDYAISATAGQTLAGMRSVRMENGSAIRLHTQSDQAIYVVTTPLLDGSQLRQITASMQLYEGE